MPVSLSSGATMVVLEVLVLSRTHSPQLQVNVSTIKKKERRKKTHTLRARDASRAPFVVVGCHVGRGNCMGKMIISRGKNVEKKEKRT